MDKLSWWEKLPILGLFLAQGLYVWQWYTTFAPHPVAVALGGVFAVAAIDGAMVSTVAGMRSGRRSRASVAAIVVTASFGALVALDLYGAVGGISAWLHAGFALTIVCYLLHLAAPRAVTRDAAERAAHAEEQAAHLTLRIAQAEADAAHWQERAAHAERTAAQSSADVAQQAERAAQLERDAAHFRATAAQFEAEAAQARAVGGIESRRVAQWLIEAGVSKRETARRLGVSDSTVRGWVDVASAAD